MAVATASYHTPIMSNVSCVNNSTNNHNSNHNNNNDNHNNNDNDNNNNNNSDCCQYCPVTDEYW